MQGYMVLASIGTEKDTFKLVFYSTQIVDGRKVELLYCILL